VHRQEGIINGVDLASKRLVSLLVFRQCCCSALLMLEFEENKSIPTEIRVLSSKRELDRV
jgi:hypothetical protein